MLLQKFKTYANDSDKINGPIVDTGIIELKTINLFIGKQSTGKSTLLKIFSHCRWIEKLLSIGKHKNGTSSKFLYTHYSRFVQELIKFYRFNPKFFSNKSEIIHIGDTFKIEFKGDHKANAKIEPIVNASPYNAKLSFYPIRKESNIRYKRN